MSEEHAELVVQPQAFLQGSLGKKVDVQLKWDTSITGTLRSFDEYMNLRLVDAEFQGQSVSDLVLRCNNILFVSACE